MARPKIEKGIKPLVDILNSVSYITTVSSCEGHPEKNDDNSPYYPNVIFEIKEGCEQAVESLIDRILPFATPPSSEMPADISKIYLKDLDGGLNYAWRIELSPYRRGVEPLVQRRIADKAIKRTVNAVKKYLKSEKKIHET